MDATLSTSPPYPPNQDFNVLSDSEFAGLHVWVCQYGLSAGKQALSFLVLISVSDSSWSAAHVVNPAENSVLLTAATLNVLPFRNSRLSTALPARHSADPAVRQFTATS